MKNITTIFAAILAATALTLAGCTKELTPVPGQDITEEVMRTVSVADTAYIAFSADMRYREAWLTAVEPMTWDGSNGTSVDVAPEEGFSISLCRCVVPVKPGTYASLSVRLIGESRRYGDRMVTDSVEMVFPSVTAAAGEVVDLGIIE